MADTETTVDDAVKDDAADAARSEPTDSDKTPSGADDTPAPKIDKTQGAKRRIQEKKNRTEKYNQLEEKVNVLTESVQSLLSKLEQSPLDQKPEKTDESVIAAMQEKITETDTRAEEITKENQRLRDVSIKDKFFAALGHSNIPVKEALQNALFSELSNRIVLDPEDSTEARVLFRDETGRIHADQYAAITFEDATGRQKTRPATLVEFLKDELSEPKFADFRVPKSEIDPGFKNAPAPHEDKSKYTVEESKNIDAYKKSINAQAFAGVLHDARNRDKAVADA